MRGMRRLTLIAVGFLIVSSTLLEARIGAQDEERARAIKECTTPGRPRPEVERNRMRPELCGKAISLPKPAYPEEAKAKNISGRVAVIVVANEEGNVIWAEATEGHPLLQEAAIKAACQARYSPEKISKRPIKVSHVISYIFVDQ